MSERRRIIDAETRAAFPHISDEYWNEREKAEPIYQGHNDSDLPPIVVAPDLGTLFGELAHPPIFQVAADGRIEMYTTGASDVPEFAGHVLQVDRVGVYALVLVQLLPFDPDLLDGYVPTWDRQELVLCRAEAVPNHTTEKILQTIRQQYSDRIGAPQLARLLKTKADRIHYARETGRLEGARDTESRRKSHWYFTADQVAAYLRRQ